MARIEIKDDNLMEIGLNEAEEVDFHSESAGTGSAHEYEFAAPRAGKFILLMDVDGDNAVSDGKITIESGDFWQSTLGDLEVLDGSETATDFTTDGLWVIGPLETARFKTSDNKIKFKLTGTDIDKQYFDFAVLEIV